MGSVMRGTVPGYESTGPLVIATDAGYKHRTAAYGYIGSDGRWGLERRPAGDPRLDTTGPSAVLVAELRAVAFALAGCASMPRRLLLDSTVAIRYLRQWQAGRTGRMPAGYSLRPRWGDSRRTPALVRLAAAMAAAPAVSVEHVPGHRGHQLNEAADALASLAWRKLRSAETRARAEGLAVAFLADWHQHGVEQTSAIRANG